jgi:hypothetical protein
MPLSSDASTPDSAVTAPQQNGPAIQKGYSCVLCAQRKVKCDKAPGGCANCSRARVGCVYKAPLPPRRRKKGVREVDVYARLRIYEDALTRLGVEPDELVKKEIKKSKRRASKGGIGDDDESDEDGVTLPWPINGAQSNSKGMLISTADGKSRYLENTLWTSLDSDFRESHELLLNESSSDEEDHLFRNTPTPKAPTAFSSDDGCLLLGTPKNAANLRPLHPQPVQIFKLWQTYLDNCNPIMRIFHAPTVQQILSNASGDLDNLPKNVEALLFSIYTMAIHSLSESECNAIMGESKAVVSQRFKMATQYALLNASFLKTSDLMVLQALVLFNTAISNHDARVIWVLTGVAVRIGQRIGLHRDPATLGLDPFSCEIRRRVWWQILMQDGFAEKLAGAGGSIMLMAEVKRPSNLNDSDIFVGMEMLPKEHEGATEMMFFLIRCHVGEFLKGFANKKSNFDGAWNKLSTTAAGLAVKDKAIDELEALYERKYLRYCDHSVPWHCMCSYLVKAILAMLRFVIHNPEHHGGSRATISEEDKDKLFHLSVQIVSYQNVCYTTKEMQGYLWHVSSHFQWKGFLYMVSELRERTQGEEVDHAWKQVQLVYDVHPNFGVDLSRRALSIAVGKFTLKAWEAYIAARGIPEGGEPIYIKILRARGAKRSTTPSRSQHAQNMPSESLTRLDNDHVAQPQSFVADPAYSSTYINVDALSNLQWDAGFAESLDPMATIPELPPLDADQLNWGVWDTLLADFETQGTGTGMGGGVESSNVDVNAGYGGWEYGMQ